MNTLQAHHALEQLVAGNQRYVNDRLSHYHQSSSRMRAISAEQHP